MLVLPLLTVMMCCGRSVEGRIGALMSALAPQQQSAAHGTSPMPTSPSMRSHRSSIAGSASHAGSHHGGPPVMVESSWEVLRAPHGRLTACAAANGGASPVACCDITYSITPRPHHVPTHFTSNLRCADVLSGELWGARSLDKATPLLISHRQ